MSWYLSRTSAPLVASFAEVVLEERTQVCSTSSMAAISLKLIVGSPLVTRTSGIIGVRVTLAPLPFRLASVDIVGDDMMNFL